MYITERDDLFHALACYIYIYYVYIHICIHTYIYQAERDDLFDSLACYVLHRVLALPVQKYKY